MKIVSKQLSFKDVVLLSQRNTLESRSQVQLEREFQFYHSPRTWRGIPIMCANMPSVATFTMARQLQKYKMVTALHKYYTLQQLQNFFFSPDVIPDYCWVTIGMKDADLEKIKDIANTNNKGLSRAYLNIVIDAPNGHIEKFVKFCAKVRSEFSNSIICAGNVTNPAMVQELIIHGGVDIVKLFVGPGSACETTKTTGVGCGTFTTSVDCSGVAHGLKNGPKKLGLVCGDGGFKEYGDISKGYCAGLDFIMIGGMFAGTDECDEAEWEYEHEFTSHNPPKGTTFWMKQKDIYSLIMGSPTGNTRKCEMKYYGMSSHYAQEKHGEGKKDYRASEGKILNIPYKGGVESVIQEILGGIRSACLYIGSESIKDMNKCAVFTAI